MKGIFIELPAFQRFRETYLDDEAYRIFQEELMKNPEAGDVIKGTGGLRKLRFVDKRRGKGKRGGLRIIYYWWKGVHQFWLFTLYDKNEMVNLTSKELKLLASMLHNEIDARSK